VSVAVDCLTHRTEHATDVCVQLMGDVRHAIVGRVVEQRSQIDRIGTRG